MENKQISVMDVLIETHAGLERQGPGSHETTVRALGFLDNLNAISRAADLGCGTGGQTMLLAQHINGSITGVDLCQNMIDVFNSNADKLNFRGRVSGILGSMDNLDFPVEEFDLIWSEGAIDNIGFEKGIRYWKRFLKKGGYLAVTSPSWFTEEHPAEVEKFWADAGSGLDTIEQNILVMQKAGYSFVAAFALSEKCWTENYFIPRSIAEKALREKYAGNKMVEDYIASNKHEVELYEKYSRHYGYAFYIGKKM
jgi:ubiquinone/menaquinone biosynthesis C-methylase UbiE